MKRISPASQKCICVIHKMSILDCSFFFFNCYILCFEFIPPAFTVPITRFRIFRVSSPDPFQRDPSRNDEIITPFFHQFFESPHFYFFSLLPLFFYFFHFFLYSHTISLLFFSILTFSIYFSPYLFFFFQTISLSSLSFLPCGKAPINWNVDGLNRFNVNREA